MVKITPKQRSKGKIRLDWRAYFYQFLETHGEHVEDEGLLLFSDGWRYSSTEYYGPEYPPPENRKTLRRLQQVYWTKLRDKYRKEHRELELRLESLLSAEAAMSLPLQQRTLIPETNGQGLTVYRKSEATDLDLSILEHQFDNLALLISECNEQLKELGRHVRKNDAS